MNYRIGLDIGIGSIGWAVISEKEEGHPARIEDFGTRIFQSGENEKTSESLCKGRRGFRGVRRIERRRANRRKMLKNHFQNIGLINGTFNDDYADVKDDDVYSLKVAGLDRKLSPAELYKCLVHTCNHRGYRDFYEVDPDDEEAGKNATAANLFEKAFRESGKRIVSEYLLENKNADGFVKFRNRSGGDEPYLLIRRDLLKEEAEKLLAAQSGYYPCLNRLNIDRTVSIIFDQRDFEDGPGDPNDSTRRYHGFIETLGKCPYYKDLERGFRGTVISDVFAVTNTLSQYRFVNKDTGEYDLPKEVACEIVESLLHNASMNMTEVKRILKKHGYQLYKSENSDDKALNKAIKFMSMAKKSVEAAGMDWEQIISEEQFDVERPSLLHSIGELISKYQTPKRRVKEMKNAGIDEALIKSFSGKKVGGTSAVSYKYMCDSIEAFKNGDIYGNFQAKIVEAQKAESDERRFVKLPPSAIEDSEIRDNRVVFKAVNETRKIVNAIIDVYGSPKDIVIEVASELGKSVEMRKDIERTIKKNAKDKEGIVEKISEMLLIDKGYVTPAMVERYKLYEEQEGKCAYSLKPLGEMKAVVANRDHAYEIDHIVPYSLILDNTLNNKVLVFTEENQKKGQRTPLMYMNDEEGKAFLTFVNHLYSRKESPISKKKVAYCNLKSIYGEEAEEILGEWKSRNINDTRYITKYIAGLFDRKLVFAGDKGQHVFTVKGAVTQKFRREWFRNTEWGEEEKNRSTYLNHALDAVIAANLTKAYIEIGSDALRLKAIKKKYRGNVTKEYEDYLNACISKMKKYYYFDEKYTERLLLSEKRVPAYVPRLREEVEARFFDGDEAVFAEKVAEVYKDDSAFTVSPHIPRTSQKQDKKYKGTIADANPLKIVEIDGAPHKISRRNVSEINEKQLDKLYTDDAALKERLSAILAGKDEKYTLGTYLKENGLDFFRDGNGKVVRKLSFDEGPVSNFYRVDKGEGNYTNLGQLKYYCVEVYEDAEGRTHTCGVRFVDIVKKDKKLYRKAESLPADYSKHVTYLFANDYIRIIGGKGELKFEGYYKAVYNINQSAFYCKKANEADVIAKNISRKDRLEKYSVDLLGKLGGKICSAPLPCTKAKE